MGYLPFRTRPEVSTFGTLAQPTSGRVDCVATPMLYGNVIAVRLDFTFALARIAVTDAAGSGSSGSLLLFTLNEGSWLPLGARQNYTSCVVSAAVDTSAGDVAYVFALGSVAADAGDGALTGTEVDWAAATSTITNASGTGAGTKHTGAVAPIDGTATANKIYLNWSGTAATTDANGTFDVNGTVSLLIAFLGDD